MLSLPHVRVKTLTLNFHFSIRLITPTLPFSCTYFPSLASHAPSLYLLVKFALTHYILEVVLHYYGSIFAATAFIILSLLPFLLD
jgi:hypothetical protein